ncbi:MAG: STAS domain-containing protein [Desulfobacterales bacterium]|jgi:anti-anti-sigma factor
MDLIQIEKHGIVTVTVTGRAAAELNLEFKEVVNHIVESDKKRLLIDLGALEYLRSSVLRVILNAVKKINQKRGKVVICCLQVYVKEIFEINYHNNGIPIAESVESGLNLLTGPLEAA